MNITQYTPRLTDDLSVIADGAEIIQIYQPDSGTLLTVPNCVAQTIKANKAPSESPQGATILEREWNASLGSRQEAVGSSNSPSANLNPTETTAENPTAYCLLPTASTTPYSLLPTPSINDIIIDSHDQQWQIVSIERKERIGRVVYKGRHIDLSPRLDEWVDIITPIYQTDDNGAPYLQKYRADATGVSVRIIRVPVSSHRQLTDVPEERIEIIFADVSIRIGAQQRIRLADGVIYKPTDLFPITQTRPALRVIAQKEQLAMSN
ncbi:MAG: hypothetical protein IJH67_05190 [Thermoguttaceae bacterium]|nr:hypothetical protein [Thermoguttaceae bacterium]